MLPIAYVLLVCLLLIAAQFLIFVVKLFLTKMRFGVLTACVACEHYRNNPEANKEFEAWVDWLALFLPDDENAFEPSMYWCFLFILFDSPP